MTASLQSVEDICNAALDLIGWDRRIGDIYEGTRASKLALDLYSQTRDALLRKAKPGFANKELTLALVKTAQANGYTQANPWNATFPPSPWGYEYLYPSDCLEFLYVQPSNVPLPDNNPLPQRFKRYYDQVPASSSVVTITLASPGVFTWTAHGLYPNATITLATTGALPTGLTPGTTYYVLGASLTPNTFEVSASANGAAINTSVSQSGVQTATVTSNLNYQAILSNNVSALGVYVAQVTDVTLWDPLFTDLVVQALAKRFTVALTKNPNALAEVMKSSAQNEMVTEQDAAVSEET